MHDDPLTELTAGHRLDLLADARRHALAREARGRRARRARSAGIRTTTAGLLFAAAARLEASVQAGQPHSSTGG